MFDTNGGPKAKNVILFIGDGLSVAHRTAARILSKGLKEGRYGGELAIDDTIMLDNAVKVAKDFAANRNDTLIVVVADHAHGVAIVGTYDDECSGPMRSRLGTYNLSQFPNYPAPNADGYPDTVDVSRRLAFVFSTYPDFAKPAGPISTARMCPRSRARPKAPMWRMRRTAAYPARSAAPATFPSMSTPASMPPTTWC